MILGLSPDVFVVIILILALISYALNKIPMVITAMLSMLIMYFSGILEFGDAFSGFSNNVTMMVMGVGIIGLALSQNGLMQVVSKLLNKLFTGEKKFGEKGFLMVAGLLIAALSTVLNPTLIVLLFFEIIDGLAADPTNPIQRKNCYNPMVTASTAGCMFTSIASTTIIMTSGFIEEAVGRPLGFFEPMVVGVPYLLAYFAFYGTIGHKMELKFFDFEENPPTTTPRKADEEVEIPKRKMYMTIAIFLVAVYFFIFSDYQLGAVCITAAAAMILTGCVTAKEAFKNVKWETVVMVACALGFAKGVDVSGAGALIANSIAGLFGESIHSTFVVMIIALIVSNLVSQVMNNSSNAAIVVPIMILMAQTVGVDPVPVALAAGAGGNLVSATPVCAPCYTIASSVGYRFRDYFIVGGAMNIVAIIFVAASLFFFYIA